MTHSERRAEAAQHLSLITNQGISIAEYSRTSGLSVRKLRYWRKRELTAQRSTTSPAPETLTPTFHRIPLRIDTSAAYTIHVGPHRLDIAHGFDEREVSRLVAILGAA